MDPLSSTADVDMHSAKSIVNENELYNLNLNSGSDEDLDEITLSDCGVHSARVSDDFNAKGDNPQGRVCLKNQKSCETRALLNDANVITKYEKDGDNISDDDDENLTNSKNAKKLEKINLVPLSLPGRDKDCVPAKEDEIIDFQTNRFEDFLIDCFYYCCCECRTF